MNNDCWYHCTLPVSGFKAVILPSSDAVSRTGMFDAGGLEAILEIVRADWGFKTAPSSKQSPPLNNITR
jgi:hypothetical protein